MKAVYGSRFATAYPTEAEIKIAKREWARDIGRHSREDIDRIFGEVKRKQACGDQSMDWPDIGRILGVCADTSEQRAFKARAREQERIDQEVRKCLTDQGARERSEAARLREMKNIRERLGL